MQPFNPERTVKHYTMTLCAPPSDVFPLLCPVRESDWIEPWSCDMVYTQSGIAEKNAIFKTDFSSQGGRETWVVCRYDPPEAIEFIRFIPEFKVNRLDVALMPAAETTRATWTHTYTGLSEAGNRWIRDLSDETFQSEKRMLEKLLNHYLKTGTLLKMVDVGPDRHPYDQNAQR